MNPERFGMGDLRYYGAVHSSKHLGADISTAFMAKMYKAKYPKYLGIKYIVNFFRIVVILLISH